MSWNTKWLISEATVMLVSKWTTQKVVANQRQSILF